MLVYQFCTVELLPRYLLNTTTLIHVFLSTQVRKSVPFPLPLLIVDVHLIHLHSRLSTIHQYAPMATLPHAPSTLVSDTCYPGFSSLLTYRRQSSVPTFFDTMDSWLTCTSTNSLTHTPTSAGYSLLWRLPLYLLLPQGYLQLLPHPPGRVSSPHSGHIT